MQYAMNNKFFKQWRDYIDANPKRNTKVSIHTIRLYGAVPWYIPDIQVINWMEKYFDNKES